MNPVPPNTTASISMLLPKEMKVELLCAGRCCKLAPGDLCHHTRQSNKKRKRWQMPDSSRFLS